MNLADAAELVLLLSLKDEVSSGLKGIQGALDKTDTKTATLQGGLKKVGQGLGTGIKNTAKIGIVGLGALWTQVDAGIESLVELEDVTNQTEAVLKSTGGQAGLTADDVRDLAVEMEDLSGVDDKVVQSAENVLLTFTNVRRDAFEPALLAALNMSEALDQDLQSSITQIGKALNDPEKGLSALSRVGVTFDEETKKIIEDMVAVGDTAGAQQIIIDELNKEFGGSAQASMEGYRGTQKRLKDTWEELQMTLAEALLPALDKLARVLDDKLGDPKIKEGVRKLGEGLADLFSDENIETGGQAITELFNFLKDLPWDSIKNGMKFAAEQASKVVEVFRSLPPGVQAGLLTFLAANKLTGGLVTAGLGELAKLALSSLKTITAANVTVIGANVTSPGGGIPDGPIVTTPGGKPQKGPGIPPAPPFGIPTAIAAPVFLAAIGASVKGDTPLPISADEVEQRARDITGQLQLTHNALTMDLFGFLRSDADTQRLIDQRGRLAAEYLSLLPQLPGWTADAEWRQWAAPLIAKQQTANLVASEIRERITVTSGNQVAQQQRMTLVASEIRERVSTQTGVNRQIGADHRAELMRNREAQAGQAQRAALIASEARERLGSIQTAAQRTAQKDFSVTVNTHVNFQVGAYKVAEALRHEKVLQGGQ